MVRLTMGSALVRYGYQARKPEEHFRCPRPGCPRVEMGENPASADMLRGRNRGVAARPRTVDGDDLSL